MVLCYICAIAYKYAFGCKMGVSFWGSINIFVGSANELQIANLLGQAKTISYGSSEKCLCVLWISLGYANPTEIIIEPFFSVLSWFYLFQKPFFHGARKNLISISIPRQLSSMHIAIQAPISPK